MFPQVSRVLSLLAVMVAVSRPCACAPEPDGSYTLKVWETDDGLPHNSITSVIQRSDGFLWIATQGGIVRFDGVNFVPLRSSLLDGTKTSSVVALFEQDADTLLIGSAQSGLIQLVRGELSVHPVTSQFGRSQKIAYLYRESETAFWIVFIDREAWRCSPAGIEKFPVPDGTKIVLWPISFARDRAGDVFFARGLGVERYSGGKIVVVDRTAIAAVAPAAGGGVWAATPRRLGRYEDGKRIFAASPPPWTGTSPPAVIHDDQRGTIWLGMREQGLLRWKDGAIATVATSHVRITGLCRDDEGNLWVATSGGGLNRLHRPRLVLVAEEPKWTSDVAGSVTEDTAGDLWFVNRNIVRQIKQGDSSQVTEQVGWPKKTLPVCADAAGNIWFGAAGEVFRTKVGATEPPTALPFRNKSGVHVIYPARDGVVWIGRDGGVVERIRGDAMDSFGRAQGFPGKAVRSIGEDAKGTIWVGTEEGRLFEIEGETFIDRSAEAGLPPHPIRAIHGDSEGRLWLATSGAGVFMRHDRGFAQITEAHGLPDDVISQILEDDYGWLWFGSRRGIFKIRKAEMVECATGVRPTITPVVFGRSDGVSGISAVGSYQPTAWKTRRGQFWFVTRKGLVTTDPAQHEENRRAPRVYLDRFAVDGRVVAKDSSQFRSSIKKLEFHFTAPTYTAPEKLRFRHRLEGFDADWSEGDTQRVAAYPTLPPGRYVFAVQASDGEAGWSPAAATRSFEILPMWWETWWAKMAATSAAAIILVSAVRLWSHRRLKARLERLEQKQRVEQERVRIARDLHDDLGASLTQASMMAEELSEDWDEIPDPKARTSSLAEQVRTIARDLDAVVWTVSPKNDQLAALSTYLCHFAEEYFRPTSMQCHAWAAPDIPPVPLSPELRHHLFMIAKELFNNALKHSHASRVELKTEMAGRNFRLQISDNGRGFSVAAARESSRNGLRNLQARVAELGGTLLIDSASGGTTAVLNLPVSSTVPAATSATES